MEYPLISVILPVYNVEKYLLQCLKSISNQTYKNIEIILIIDGAKDNSYNLANEYALKDKRISVYWQENAGSGPARNKGIALAKGDYLAFVDPDDWIADDYIEVLYNTIINENVDLVLSGKTDNIFQDKRLIKQMNAHIDGIVLKNSTDVRTHYIKFRNLQLLSAPTQKLFKRKIIVDNHVAFPNLRRSQDIVFNYRYYDYITSLALINYHGYQYRVEQSDYVLKLPPNYSETIVCIYKEIKNMHKKWGVKFDEHSGAIMSNKVVNAYVESLILRNMELVVLYENIDLMHIVQVAKAKSVYEKLMKFFIIHRCTSFIKCTIKVKRIIKSIV